MADEKAPDKGQPVEKKPSALRKLLAFVCSTKMIPIVKGTLAFTITMAVILLRDFEDLTPFPPALASMIIVSLAGNVGGTIGATIQSVFLALVGVCVGGLAFFVLAHLHDTHVAQGFILFVFVYFAALVKARGPKWFGLSLFAVLMAFNGIYTSVLLGGYRRDYLVSYLEAYAWGAAIVLGVNLLVWPTSAEMELRRTLVLSLEHVGTLGHLLSKTYTMTITEDEKEVRDHLAQSLRADFGFLTQKIQDTMIEVNWSKYSMQDYSEFVLRTRALQLAAISAHSSLMGVEDRDTDLFKQHFLPSTIEPFLVFRRCVEHTFKEVSAALQCKPLTNAKSQPGYKQFMPDMEAQRRRGADRESVTDTAAPEPEDTEALAADLQRINRDVERQLEIVSRRLEHEVEHTDGESTAHSPVDARSDTVPNGTPPAGGHEHDTSAEQCKKTANGIECGCGVDKMMPTFDRFSLTQQRILSEVLTTGVLHGKDQKMRMHLPQPSIRAAWSGDKTPRMRGAQTPRSYAPSVLEDVLDRDEYDDVAADLEEDAETEANHHSLLRVYTFVFAMRVYVQQLEWYHQAAVKFNPNAAGHPPRRLQIHFFQQLHNPWGKAMRALRYTPPPAKATAEESTATIPEPESELSFKEAMALLENREYVRKRKTLWQRFKTLEEAARTPMSIFALKTAAGALVFAMLLFAETTRQFFINYGLQVGVLTLVVSISPTLGQTLLTFVLQVAGSGTGYLWGVALLEMFRGVGGYTFNPYGMVALLGASAMPLMYFIYFEPKFFVFALLALNSAGVLITTEWIYVEYYKRPFDSPIYRAGKSVTALGIALGVAVVLQVFILRNPARRTVRKAMANLTFSVLSYYTLFHAWARAVIPYHMDDLNERPPNAAIVRVNQELLKRELKIQQDIIDMMPLLVFAGAERDFGTPFRADLASKMLKSLQLMMDRLKEARYTIGTSKVPDIITREFSQRLSPYRRRNIKLTKASLHTCAASLASKAPLPGETPARMYLQSSISDNLHDALLIASHLSKTPEGRECVLNGELTRYFAYVMTVTSMANQIINLEDACHDLFGDMDEKLA